MENNNFYISSISIPRKSVKRFKVSYRSLGKASLSLFLALNLAIAGVDIWEKMIGVDIGGFVPQIIVLELIVLTAAMLAYEKGLSRSVPISRYYIITYSFMLILMLIIGIMRENYNRLIYMDIINFLFIIIGFVIGRNDESFHDMNRTVFVLSATTVLLGFLFTDTTVIYDRGLLKLQEGYDVQNALFMLPLFLLLAAQNIVNNYPVLLITTINYFGLLLIFTKRAPSVRILLFIVCSFIWAMSKKVNIRRLLVIITVIFIAAFIVSRVIPWDVLFTQTLSRISGYSTDAGELSFSDNNFRLFEAKYLLSTLEPIEWIAGRGLGGYFTESPLGIWERLGPNSNEIGRLSLHIGILYPILKGGLVWFIISHLPVFILVFSRRQIKQSDGVSKSCWYYAIIYLLFQLIEGPPTVTIAQFPFIIGLIGARAQNIYKST